MTGRPAVGPLSDFGVEDGLLERLRAAPSVMVVGDADSGKTTFVQALADSRRDTRRAVVDLDTGQSRLGPPTTLGWTLALEGEPFRWESARAAGIYFTGTTSAVGNLLVTLTGAKLVFDRAMAAAGHVIVDTSGLVAEGPGWALKEQKIELLRPDAVVALQHGSELEPMLLDFKGAKPDIIRLAVPPAVGRKTREQRTAWRAARWRDYFAGAREFKVSWDEVTVGRSLLGKETPVKDVARLEEALHCRVVYAEGIDHMLVVCDERPPPLAAARARRRLKLRGLHVLVADELIGRVVGLRDADGLDQAVGVITEVDWTSHTITFLAPQPVPIASLVLGAERGQAPGE